MSTRWVPGFAIALAAALCLASQAGADVGETAPLPDLGPYQPVDSREYSAMGGSWLVFSVPTGLTCVLNADNGSYGCEGPIPGVPDANLISAPASGAPRLSSVTSSIFAAAGDAKPLPPNSRLSYGEVSCGVDGEATVSCRSERTRVGFTVSRETTVISGVKEHLRGPHDSSQPIIGPASASKVGRIFTGDYCTDDLSQWNAMQNVTAAATGNASMHWAQYRDLYGSYPVSVLPADTACGYAARFELRPGDTIGKNERTEVADVARPVDVTRWEAFSIKFDPTYPLSGGTDFGWAVTNQWVDASGLWWGFAVGPEKNGWSRDGATPAGKWSLNYTTLAKAPPAGGQIRLLDVPFIPGEWIDVKMQVGWRSNESGFVRVWINGEPQELRYSSFDSPGSADTFTGQMVWNNSSGTFYYKEGLYRAGGVGYPVAIVHHANYRSASDEASL